MIGHDFVNAIKQLAEEACRLSVIQLDPSNREVIIHRGDCHERVILPPPPYCDTVNDGTSLIKAVCDMALLNSGKPVRVYVSADKIEALAMSSYDARITMTLSPTVQWKTLQELGKPTSHAAYTRALRTGLKGCYDPQLLAIMSRIDFKRLEATQSTKKAAVDTFGKSVEMAAQSAAGEAPEVVRLVLQPIDAPRINYGTIHLDCSQEIDQQRQEFSLLPVGSEAVNAIQTACYLICETIEEMLEDFIEANEADITVLYGTAPPASKNAR